MILTDDMYTTPTARSFCVPIYYSAGVINMYEGYLAQQNGGKRGSITYQIQNLFKYIEQLPECAAFVMESKSGMYTPRGKNWLKTQILSHLKGEATKGSAGGRR